MCHAFSGSQHRTEVRRAISIEANGEFSHTSGALHNHCQESAYGGMRWLSGTDGLEVNPSTINPSAILRYFGRVNKRPYFEAMFGRSARIWSYRGHDSWWLGSTCGFTIRSAFGHRPDNTALRFATDPYPTSRLESTENAAT